MTARETSDFGEIVLVAAMFSEVRHAVERLTNAASVRVGPWRAWRGSLAGWPILAVESGIGMVNASAALATVLAARKPRAIVNFGCAGAHRPDVHAGDVVVGTEYLAPGSVTILPDGTEQYDGFRYDVEGELYMHPTLAADPMLLEAAQRGATAWQPAPWPGDLESAIRRVIFGPVASADCWTQHPARIALLHERHGSLCEEMEAAALAQVSAIHRIPFLAIKDISNNELITPTALGSGGPTLHDVRDEVGARAFALVERTLLQLVPTATP